MAEQTISLNLGEICVLASFKRVKYARIRISPDCAVRASVPWFWSVKRAQEFIASHEIWIKKTLEKYENLALKENESEILGQIYELKFGEKFADLWNTAPKFSAQNFSGGDTAPKFCESGTSDTAPSATPNTNSTNAQSAQSATPNEILAQNLAKFNGKIAVLESKIYCVSEIEFAKFKKFLALNLYKDLIKLYLPFVQKSVNRLVVRDMKTRWGSCNSTKGYINLSLKLVEKDLRFVHYVVLHELTHLIYAHHRREFYDFIAGIMPDFKERINLVKNR
ncbi:MULTISPECIES: M48 family metallopeptidase [unclassified Campylobacter]|uniref:M48 family metallopeptidase n=1 Tax=unclassified Campylobacter TaxID=2593542 RepID=UPI0022E9D0BD|nr:MULTISPECIES: YgjP-like metallopeptidase domain-containing protein [unclassified Campylobacter]MDA3062324.1 M48 family metallopeptidase [Campylobacter sp. JMF_14 EL1]MDA3073558.1 M48 family metallopeptidase [Campylobacter sp. JMF_10 EL2]